MKSNNEVNIIAVCGPTATGKTELAIRLCNALDGEVVSCDSMQIYKGYDIGTAKPTEEERQRAKHHLVSFVEPYEDFSVSDYVSAAEKVVSEIWERGKMPVLTGGTGLYMRSLLKGVSFGDPARDDGLREKLEQEAQEYSKEYVYEKLKSLDPEAAAVIHPNNLKRVIRAIEYTVSTGKLFSSQMRSTGESDMKFNYVMLCLTYRDRQLLYDKIGIRVDLMLKNGLLDEARGLYDSLKGKDKIPTLAQAIGYKELFPYFEGKVSFEEAVENIKKGTRNYAKRQMTWFRREESINFIYLDEISGKEQLLNSCLEIINKTRGD